MLELSQLGAVPVEEKRELLKTLLDLQSSDSTGLVSLSHGQMSLWFLYQLAPESPAYNFLYAARIHTLLDLTAFRKACQALVERHPMLRTRFVVQDHKPIQQVEARLAIEIPMTDASSWSEERLLEVLRQRADVPFQLEQTPCLGIELFQRSPIESVLLLVFPHIIADLWSADLLLQELRHLYTALSQGEASGANLPLPSASFTDFVRWQMMQAYSERGQRSRRYWHELLGGELPVLSLPTDRPRPPLQTYNGTAHSWSLKPESDRRVRALAGELAVTPFSALLTVFQLLLHRLSGQEDILVGTAVAGRDRPEWEGVVGYFLNQVVFRARFSTNPTFRGLLEETRDQVHQALEHQSYPFGLLVKQLHPRRDPARPPIFQVMFIWDKPRDLGLASSQGRGLEVETLLMEQRGAPFDLTLILFEVGEGLTACFRYNSDLFDPATIQRWAGHFDTLLEALLDAPDQPVTEVPILSSAERQRILVEWNRTEIPYPSATFPKLFEQQVQRDPKAAAVAYEGLAWSYEELNQRANQVAAHLHGLGVRRGDTVASSLPRGPGLIVALLGVWKAGAVHLFLDPAYPPLRLESLIAEARPAALIGTTIPGLLIPTVSVEDPPRAGAWGSYKPGEPADVPTPEDRAYIIYTSGSTGQPKGAILRHAGVSNLLTAQQQILRIQPGDRVLQFASFSFDAAIWEVISALGCGATLVLADPPSLLPGRPLWQVLREQAITCVTLPPSALALLPVEPLPALKTLVVAGETCSEQLVVAWAPPAHAGGSPSLRFLNAYGPTETTVCATVGECVANQRPPTIGKPIANMRVYVLDQHFEPVPVGVAGELYIAGPSLALGYVNRPDLTTERFLPCPFDQADEATMYRTGDVVRWTVQGELEFLGRTDQQVKLRGYRIELEEIQAVLRGHASILDAVTIVRDDLPGGPGLAAYVIPRRESDFSVSTIRAYLRERLPHYMLPAAVVPLESFPVGRTGKVDRSRLPLPQPAPHVNGTGNEVKGTARTPMERLLAQVWSRVLIRDRVGVHDNFFDLGGASVQVLEVVALARSQGVQLSPEKVFRHQTIAELAAALEGARQTESSEHRVVSTEYAALSAQPAAESAPPSAGSVVESMGVYLPEQVWTTDQIMKGCRKQVDFPLARLTGIRSRRIAGDTEFSIDLAEKAVAECLGRSTYRPEEIDLVICCNISRCDGPMFRFSLEPTSAARICRRFGLTNALAFDITNACAGTFTAILMIDAFIRHGIIDRAMVVSGEYITHLTSTAQREIESFLDSRLACLTLGDSGSAMILVRAPRPEVGFQEIELYTLGKYHNLCVAKLSSVPGSGPIMHTDSVTSTTVTIKQAVGHALEVLKRKQWDLDKVDALVIHQTSETTLDGAIHEINRVVGRPVCHRENTLFNVAERGNTATNTHFLALWERMHAGGLEPGDRVVFAVSGSGQAVGTALYIVDDLPEKIRNPKSEICKSSGRPTEIRNPLRHFRCGKRVRIESIGTIGGQTGNGDTVAILREAGEACLSRSARPREDIDLVLHTGVNRSEFLSEPAVAAIAAGVLAINHEEPQNAGQRRRRTLAFDVLNGAGGTLTGCFLASELIATGKFSRALLLASEVEHNRQFWPENLIGLEETASALVLEESASEEGFTAFAFRAFPEHVDAIVSFTGVHETRPAVVYRRAADLDDRIVECVCQTVREWTAHQPIPLGEVTLVVAPQRPGGLEFRIGEALGIERSRVVSLGAERDYFTSSLAYAMLKLRQEGGPVSDAPILFIEVAAGLQVWCGLYHGSSQERALS
jgi:amino acid adenylation domain-containing protein